jgi:hypothetical protein
MWSSKDKFMRRLQEEWLPAYCNDPGRLYSIEGYRAKHDNLTENDAKDFLRALDNSVAAFGDRERLRMAHGHASETLFWEHERNIVPRPITLWLETVITVAVGARLHLNYGWPIASLGMQSKDSAFDVMAFRPPDFTNEHVAVEVKKSSRELNLLMQNLTRCCIGDHDTGCQTNATRVNAHRKWIAISSRRPKFFWAVGPSPDSRLYKVYYADHAQTITLQPVELDKLNYLD